MNFTFRQLKVFIIVAEQGNMRSAATTLQLTRPAVSLQIKELEKNTGLALFARQNRGLALSPGGKHFLIYAKRLIADLKEAESAVAHFKELGSGTLTIGIQRTTEYFVPRLLGLFHDKHPGVEVRMRIARNRHQLFSFMDFGDVDLAVMARPPNDVAAHAQRFAANPYVFVCPPKHSLLGTTVPVRGLTKWPFIAREQGSATRIAMERFLTNHRCSPKISMEFESNEAIKQSIMAGMGLGFLSLHCIGLELQNGLLGVLRIADTPVMEAWNLISLPSKVLSPAAEAFRRFLIEEGESFLHAQDSMLLSAGITKKSTDGRNVRRKPRISTR